MSDFTVVSDDVLEPGDPIRSVDILAIKNNTLFLFDAAFGFPILNVQSFSASGTWTRPSVVFPEAASILVILVGGGGSGASQSALDPQTVVPGVNFSLAGGGGSGGIAIAGTEFNNTNTTATINIGSGAVNTTSSGSQAKRGNTGGATTFTMTNGNITANGGAGGAPQDLTGVLGASGGGEGGITGSTSSTGVWSDRLGFGRAGRRMNIDNTTQVTPIPTYSGGGAFGRSASATFAQNQDGGPAFPLVLVNNQPFMGAGGIGTGTTAGNGQAFGGGGGGAAATSGSVTSGAGANGGALVFLVRGIVNSTVFNEKHIQIT